ncbi:hypothetical protein Tco_0242488 [Tanacetum coccineum]
MVESNTSVFEDLRFEAWNLSGDSLNLPDHVIMEYLVNISKRRASWSLNEDILKINDSDNQYTVSIKQDTTYPACTHQRPQRNEAQYALSRRCQYAVSKI